MVQAATFHTEMLVPTPPLPTPTPVPAPELEPESAVVVGFKPLKPPVEFDGADVVPGEKLKVVSPPPPPPESVLLLKVKVGEKLANVEVDFDEKWVEGGGGVLKEVNVGPGTVMGGGAGPVHTCPFGQQPSGLTQ